MSREFAYSSALNTASPPAHSGYSQDEFCSMVKEQGGGGYVHLEKGQKSFKTP
jgi:hypothetical protein